MNPSKHEPADFFVKEAYVNQGPTLKRISPAPMGRAYKIRKRSCHLTIVVATKANLGGYFWDRKRIRLV